MTAALNKKILFLSPLPLLPTVATGQALQCYECKIGFWNLCITGKVTCEAGQHCFSGVGKAGEKLTVQHSAHRQDVNMPPHPLPTKKIAAAFVTLQKQQRCYNVVTNFNNPLANTKTCSFIESLLRTNNAIFLFLYY